ncbi:hypothetical protein PVK06_017784 [Gossypium arboreum]|uniref:Uncharacterized protein n=1 Tax=Gossypium arboreum TaxID=29729 RepID=A0ABR0Q4U7_GOSAR|nr:hypothetical protein PVK06_017784 [Gossypium arboreum]
MLDSILIMDQVKSLIFTSRRYYFKVGLVLEELSEETSAYGKGLHYGENT